MHSVRKWSSVNNKKNSLNSKSVLFNQSINTRQDLHTSLIIKKESDNHSYIKICCININTCQTSSEPTVSAPSLSHYPQNISSVGPVEALFVSQMWYVKLFRPQMFKLNSSRWKWEKDKLSLKIKLADIEN